MAQIVDVALLPEFVRFFETGELAPGAFAADVYFDMNVPSWRYQIEGHEAVAGLFHSDGPAHVRLGAVTQTGSGFVAEINYDTTEDGTDLYYRSVSIVTVRDGQISAVTHYCTGPWDPATRARQAVEAPMLRADDQ
jgi:hypothetical protein